MLANKQTKISKLTQAAGVSQQWLWGPLSPDLLPEPHSSSLKQPGVSPGTHALIPRSLSECDETPAYILNLHLNQEFLNQPNLHRIKTWRS